jgi:hypothetical protein
MDHFLKIYKEECKQAFSANGFKSIGNNHYRVVNDVFQAFHLHRSLYGDHCTLNFGITPLCYGIDQEYKRTMGGIYGPDAFEGRDDWWYYDRNSIENMQSCIQTMVSYIQRKILPFFDSGTDCASAYAAICKLENVTPQTMDETPAPGGECGYYMLLKMGEYKKVIADLRHTIACLEYENPNMLEMDKTPEYYERRQKWITECTMSLRLIQSGDNERIRRYIEEKERQSRITLRLPLDG